MSRETQIAERLIDIEAQLRALGQWDKVPPSSAALVSSQPFCVDTLTLPQWLQFVLIPTLYRLLEQGSELPDRCGIEPMAQEYFRGTGLPVKVLLAALAEIDGLLSQGDAGLVEAGVRTDS